jgi:STE24 endopeptidase
MFFAPVFIFPLFNKFEALPDGDLKKAIEDFAKKENFKLNGIFVTDGSKRSTKANAYFVGFGRFRRIALYDTLIQKHSIDELLAILAHEIGHYKERHIWKQMTLSFITTLLMFYVLGFAIKNPMLFSAFQMQNVSVYASLIFFSILYSPLSTLFSLVNLYLSRKYEFEADAYSSRTYKNPLALAEALKKLSVENLANLTPHPLKVFLEYTHPPVIQRIKILKSSH